MSNWNVHMQSTNHTFILSIFRIGGFSIPEARVVWYCQMSGLKNGLSLDGQDILETLSDWAAHPEDGVKFLDKAVRMVAGHFDQMGISVICHSWSGGSHAESCFSWTTEFWPGGQNRVCWCCKFWCLQQVACPWPRYSPHGIRIMTIDKKFWCGTFGAILRSFDNYLTGTPKKRSLRVERGIENLEKRRDANGSCDRWDQFTSLYQS